MVDKNGLTTRQSRWLGNSYNDYEITFEDKVLTSHLGFPIEAELLEKPRNHVTLVMLTNADKFGLFNEHGSVHTKQLKSLVVFDE